MRSTAVEKPGRFWAVAWMVGALLFPIRTEAAGSAPGIPDSLAGKIGSGRLMMQILQRQEEALTRPLDRNAGRARIHLYLPGPPDANQAAALEKIGVRILTGSWTPPLAGHPMGYLLADIPAPRFLDVLRLSFVRRMDTAENLAEPQTNQAAKAIQADAAWTSGYNGTGVKVAILDSGLDSEPANPDLPASFEKKDYSNPYQLDDNVENQVTGHGTHVTGIVLGRGALSSANTGNGGGAYKGVAPAASLVFLKIGRDSDGAATGAAMEAALTAAVSTYGADLISMSYGGWGTYNDGSESTEQKIDWCYSQGVPVFVSAGNEADDARHYSNTVGPQSATGFIQVNVSGVTAGTVKLSFNLVWRDGAAVQKALTFEYYDAALNKILDITDNVSTESPRGTESHTSFCNAFASDGTYYLKVINSSDQTVFFHLYEYWGSRQVRFQNADPAFTVSNPSTADHAMSVAAWTTRTTWKSSDGNTYVNPVETEGAIASFSSRGPRIDWLQKPDLTAPGSVIISIRDRDRFTTANANWVDNDGVAGGDANYFIMQGTSMACPMAAGTAALLLDKDPAMTPQAVYDALLSAAATDAQTGTCPNDAWGYGKLNAVSGLANSSLAEFRIFMEGPYSAAGDTMITSLKKGGVIPLLSPYPEDARTAGSVPAAAVDWILVQLRQAADGPAVASSTVFLRKDGRCITDDGLSTRIRLNAVPGDYYLLIGHRNHLKVMSANPLHLDSGHSTLYDFSLGSGQFYGTGGAKPVESGVWGMIGGNAYNGNTAINVADYMLVKGKFGRTGYLPEDINLSGGVTVADYMTTKTNFGKKSAVP
jgi:subtilisin family serine protease